MIIIEAAMHLNMNITKFRFPPSKHSRMLDRILSIPLRQQQIKGAILVGLLAAAAEDDHVGKSANRWYK
jgi:hypothetical protein